MTENSFIPKYSLNLQNWSIIVRIQFMQRHSLTFKKDSK